MANAEYTTSPPVRWTAHNIRKATALPKPRGAIRKADIHDTGGSATRDLASLERRLLRAIVDSADLLDVVTPAPKRHSSPDRWLLVRAPAWLLDLLAAFEADREDLEDGGDREPGGDKEPDEDGEYDGTEKEPTVVYPDTMMRIGLKDDAVFPTLDEHRARRRARLSQPMPSIACRPLGEWRRL